MISISSPVYFVDLDFFVLPLFFFFFPPLSESKWLPVRALQFYNFLKSMKTLCLSNKQEVIGNDKNCLGPLNTEKAYPVR